MTKKDIGYWLGVIGVIIVNHHFNFGWGGIGVLLIWIGLSYLLDNK